MIFVLCDSLPFTALTGWFYVMESVNVSCEVGSRVLNIRCVKYVLHRVNEKGVFPCVYCQTLATRIILMALTHTRTVVYPLT